MSSPSSISTNEANRPTPQQASQGKEKPDRSERLEKSASSLPESSAPKHFDLTSSLYKRRGGLGWNADRNWVPRWFTLHGSILCYYNRADAAKADPSRPRGRINLAKEETVVLMHLSTRAGAPTEFLITINIYTLGSKRKWEMCCKNRTEQGTWFEALKKFDGKQDSSRSGSPEKRRRIFHQRKGSDVPMLSDEEDDDSTLYDSNSIMREKPKKRKSQIMVERALNAPLEILLDFNVIGYVVCINATSYIMRVGPPGTFWVALLLANYIVIHACLWTYGSNAGSSYPSLPIVESADEREEEDEVPPFSRIIPAGSTISRAKAKEGSDLEKVIEEHGIVSPAAVRACAEASKDDYVPSPHTYFNADASVFNLRIGPNYKKNKEKAPSAAALYDLLSVDFVRSRSRLKRVSEGFELPVIPGISDIDTGHPDVPPIIIFNPGMPMEEPSLMKASVDGPTYVLAIYMVISQNTIDELKDFENASPAVKLLVKWCQQAGADADIRGRFKAMAVLDDIESLGLPSFIAGFNGKPALVTKSGSFVKHKNYIEMSCNVFMFSYVAKKSLFSLQSKFPSFVLNVGFTIEGRDDDELPEVLLGGVRLLNIDLNKVPSVVADKSDAVH